ncbi:helix-turn-helix domain-containing protein [Corynebacterium liangguodongii]|nr:helix-turn-helix domain-containing protein [Corynebacterium liangguodongii]
MATTTLLRESVAPAHQAAHPERIAAPEPLLREALGMSLRAFRADKNVSLRELASRARVSSGYISELERGRKEVSSELLAAICDALDTTVAEVLVETVTNLSLRSITAELERTAPAAAEI